MLDGFALLLVDDHPLFRDGLGAALRHEAPGLRLQAVGTPAEALAALARAGGEFDLVLLDYRLPGTDGLRCAAELMRQYPEVAVGLMSGLDDPELPQRARTAGLCAYLPKSLELPTLLECLQRLAAGEPVFGPTRPLELPGADALGQTGRQREVLRALASGGTNKEIARAIGIAPATVKRHLESIFVRIGAANRLQAVMLARAMLDEPPP